MFNFHHFQSAPKKTSNLRQDQISIVKELESSFLAMLSHQKNPESFKRQSKLLLEKIKFSVEKNSFDDDILDAIFEIGDLVVGYVASNYGRKNPVEIIKDIATQKDVYMCS